MTKTTKSDNKTRIIEAANRLVYQRGYNQTSFADVAEAVGLSKGNLHYHFRSKEELLNAVIQHRIELIQHNLAEWDKTYSDSKHKLKRFVQMLLNEESDLVRYGCPLGSLNMELGKCQQDLRDQSRMMFDLFQAWLEKAFKQLGVKDSKALSLHLLSRAQGAALLSYVYADGHLLKNECERTLEWSDLFSPIGTSD